MNKRGCLLIWIRRFFSLTITWLYDYLHCHPHHLAKQYAAFYYFTKCLPPFSPTYTHIQRFYGYLKTFLCIALRKSIDVISPSNSLINQINSKHIETSSLGLKGYYIQRGKLFQHKNKFKFKSHNICHAKKNMPTIVTAIHNRKWYSVTSISLIYLSMLMLWSNCMRLTLCSKKEKNIYICYQECLHFQPWFMWCI